MSKWKKVKLGDVCSLYQPKTIPTKELKDDMPYYVYGANGIIGKYHSYNHIDSEIAIACRGATCGTVNITLPKSWITGNAMVAHIESNELSFKYLFYALSNANMKNVITGAAQPQITRSNLKDLEIPLPAMEEQKKIAARLDAVSDLLAKQKQLLSEQDNLIQSTFYDMFGTPEINEKGFPAHKISEICELNPKKPKEIDDNTECSFVPMSAVSEDGELNLTQIKLYEDVKKGFTYFAEEDVLFAKITPCMENGKGTIAKGLKNKLGFGSTEFHVLRPLNDISNARWLFQITKFKKFRENAEKSMTGSAGQKRVPAGFFDNYFIPVPPFELQQKFAAVAEQIESEKSKIKSAIAETQTLFNALMSEYFEE